MTGTVFIACAANYHGKFVRPCKFSEHAKTLVHTQIVPFWDGIEIQIEVFKKTQKNSLKHQTFTSFFYDINFPVG